eukprot:1154939-Pelagomonas_calceolata.AAC.5
MEASSLQADGLASLHVTCSPCKYANGIGVNQDGISQEESSKQHTCKSMDSVSLVIRFSSRPGSKFTEHRLCT